jgi:hypothetical protein
MKIIQATELATGLETQGKLPIFFPKNKKNLKKKILKIQGKLLHGQINQVTKILRPILPVTIP